MRMPSIVPRLVIAETGIPHSSDKGVHMSDKTDRMTGKVKETAGSVTAMSWRLMMHPTVHRSARPTA